MRYSRIVRLIMRLFLLLLASTMSFISFLGGYSALLILGDEDNIDLDVSFEGDLLVDPLTFEVNVDFEINNRGYFDLEDLEIEMILILVYHKVGLDEDGDGESDAVETEIYDDDKSFKTIKAGEKKKNTLSLVYEDLLKVNWTDIALYADSEYDVNFIAEDVEISAKYSLGLIAFRVEIDKIDLGDYSLP